MVNVIKLLKFENWLKTKDSDNNWITVAQSRKFRENELDNDFFTISTLADKCKPDKLVADSDWFTLVEFGNPVTWTENGKVNYDSYNLKEKEGVKIHPFVVYRSWYKKSLDSKFELIRDFILFYNLYWDERNLAFKTISETGEEFEVVKINSTKDQKRIEINTKFLRNYLAIKNKILIRQHDLTRFTSESLKSLMDKESEDLSLTGEFHNYSLVMAEQPCSYYNSFSRLLGKDLVLPYKEGKALLEWEKKYTNFIICVDEEGNEIEETCDEKQLSNFFVNRGKPHFLTPIYFKREVLKKYYDNPSKYSVSSTSLNCSGLWLIHIDTTDKDLIQVWLGDLGHIPYNEQQHWRQYNVISKGITESRFRRDFMAEFCDPEDIMYRFFNEFNEFQKNFEKSFGFTLIMPLKHEDGYIRGTLRVPLNDEQPEFDSQISGLAKTLPDSIDVKSIRQNLISQGVTKDELEDIKDKKIRCLEIFLEKNGLDTDLIGVLDLIQDIRSKCIAHRRGKNCVKLLKKHGLNEKTNVEIFKLLINDFILSFKKTFQNP